MFENKIKIKKVKKGQHYSNRESRKLISDATTDM
jgi:hypothetical protein